MYCNKCGEPIDQDSRFCRHCGAAQDSQVTEGGQRSPPIIPDQRKPASRTGRTIGIAAAALLGLAVIGSAVGGSKDRKSGANAVGEPLESSEPIVNASASQEPRDAPADSWVYTTDVDKVRGGTSYFASTTSTNTIHQDPPYDPDTLMHMTVRRMPSSGTDVVLSISSGQFMCPSYEGCSGTVRFDNGRAQSVRFNGPADNSSDTIFVVSAKSFIANLKKSKKVVVEKTLYEAGEPQFEFDVSGLKWDH